MKGLLQRVKSASVTINGNIYSKINSGLLVLVCVENGDIEENAKKLAQKIVNLRIFEDDNEKMNLSLRDVGGEILAVSQFTLAGNCKKGTRPSFENAATQKVAKKLYEDFVTFLKQENIHVETGVFGAMMDVALINNGPVTIMVEK